MKVQALFGKKTAPAKAAPAKSAGKAAKAAKAAPKSSGPKKSGGWLGSDSQSQDLSKW
jgi:hypothetical protein